MKHYCLLDNTKKLLNSEFLVEKSYRTVCLLKKDKNIFNVYPYLGKACICKITPDLRIHTQKHMYQIIY